MSATDEYNDRVRAIFKELGIWGLAEGWILVEVLREPTMEVPGLGEVVNYYFADGRAGSRLLYRGGLLPVEGKPYRLVNEKEHVVALVRGDDC